MVLLGVEVMLHGPGAADQLAVVAVETSAAGAPWMSSEAGSAAVREHLEFDLALHAWQSPADLTGGVVAALHADLAEVFEVADQPAGLDAPAGLLAGLEVLVGLPAALEALAGLVAGLDAGLVAALAVAPVGLDGPDVQTDALVTSVVLAAVLVLVDLVGVLGASVGVIDDLGVFAVLDVDLGAFADLGVLVGQAFVPCVLADLPDGLEALVI